LRGMILGALLTIIFTASNVYLGLKVGLTFSSAIPAAVISMAILKMAKDSNILENNMVQTQASAAGTLSAVIFIIPGMLMIGYWQHFEFWQTLIVSACGGCLGVLFTIPLRRAMVVHSDLPYPEGRAAAEILKVGDKKNSGEGLKEIFSGGIIGGLITLATNGLHLLGDNLSLWFGMGKGVSQFALGYSGALVGAGYLVGLAGGLAMLAGVLIAWGIFVPYFTAAGDPAVGQSMQDFAQSVYRDKVRLIGAGAMGVAAVWTLLGLLKPVADGVKEALQSMRVSAAVRQSHRTDTDLPMRTVLIIFGIMFFCLTAVFYSFVGVGGLSFGQEIFFALLGTVVAVAMGFFVAAACAYMAGMIGTSASPISGIIILGIIVSSLVIMTVSQAMGLFNSPEMIKFATAAAIFTTSIILSIACISNDNMQDLKTGYLVGATPWRQQIALLLGCVVGAFVIAPVLNLLYEAYGFTGALPRADMDPDAALAAPQANLMTTIAQGIFYRELPWEYIYCGIGVGIVIVAIDAILKRSTKKLCLPPLAVGMGIYLPPALQTPLIVGAIMGYLLERKLKARGKDDGAADAEAEAGRHRGTLFASGLIVGESLIGVLLALVIVLSVTGGGSSDPLSIVGSDFAGTAEWLGLAAFVLTLLVFCKFVLGRNSKS